MIALLKRMLSLLALVSAGAHAAMSPDPTGFWYNPAESGWGASLAQQGDTVFATLFVYDEQKRAQWFVASSVTAAGSGVFSGPLYRTSGPVFSGAFNPAAVDVQSVGTLSIQYDGPGGTGLLVSYTVNGVTVNKALVRQTWAANATRLVGAYFGGINFSAVAFTQPAGCPAAPTFLPPGGPLRITMSEPGTIAIIGSEGTDTRTFIGGVYFQSGQLGIISGNVFSGSIAAPLRIADAQVTNLVVTDDGFVAHLRMTMTGGCLYDGTLGGVRRP